MKNRYAIPLSWRNALLSVLLTVGLWLAPWIVWPSLRPAPSVTRGTPPVVRYVRASEAMDGAAWSPVVFPLPTPEGFSRKAAPTDAGQSAALVLRPGAAEAVYLEVRADTLPAADMGVLISPDSAAFHPQAPAQSSLPMPSAPPDRLRIDWDEALAQRHCEAEGLKRFVPADAGLTWLSAAAYIELDPQGRVQHVFLENSSGQTNVDRLIVRALYGGNATPGSGPASGRVRLNYWKTVSPVEANGNR